MIPYSLLFKKWTQLNKSKYKSKEPSREDIVKEILSISKVPFRGRRMSNPEIRAIKIKSKFQEEMKYSITPMSRNEQDIEDVELEHLHSALLSKNISRSINRQIRKSHNNSVFPPVSKSK